MSRQRVRLFQCHCLCAHVSSFVLQSYDERENTFWTQISVAAARGLLRCCVYIVDYLPAPRVERLRLGRGSATSRSLSLRVLTPGRSSIGVFVVPNPPLV